MVELSEMLGWPQTWFFDGRRALFAPELFIAQHEQSLPVSHHSAMLHAECMTTAW